MMVVREMSRFDTLDFCETLNIDLERFLTLDAEMKDRRRNPGYSSYTPQLFMSQLNVEEYGLLQEKLYKFPGIYIQNRTEWQYNFPNMGLVLGYIAEVDRNKMAETLLRGGMITWEVRHELSHEEDLRGEKGVEVLLRDAHGRIQGDTRRERTIKHRSRGETSPVSISSYRHTENIYFIIKWEAS